MKELEEKRARAEQIIITLGNNYIMNRNSFTSGACYRKAIEEAIAKAVADYRKDYPNNTGFTRKCVLDMETMVNLLLSMQECATRCLMK